MLVTRWLLPPLIGFALVVMLALTAANLYVSLRNSGDDDNPLRYSSPQKIIGSKVLHRGEEFEVYREKCNDSDETVAVLGKSDWRSVSGFAQAIPYRASAIPLPLPANGCDKRNGRNMIPEDLPYGVWVLEGQDCIAPAQVIRRAWHTEQFQVVPR